MKKTIYFVRHAQSRPSHSLPTAQWPLSTNGMIQANQLVDVLPTLGIEQVFSSPYLRCLQTIGPFSQHAGLTVEQRDDLHEVEIIKELRSDFSEIWARAWKDFDFSLPECESHGHAQRRFLNATKSVLLESRASTIAICAHGAVIGLLLHAIEPGSGREQADALTNPDVLRIISDDEIWTWDRTFRLPGLSNIVSHHAETPIDWE
jgi:2,3-bisphosphoglycerate-dependent phosphoglycerate mutase